MKYTTLPAGASCVGPGTVCAGGAPDGEQVVEWMIVGTIIVGVSASAMLVEVVLVYQGTLRQSVHVGVGR